MADDMITIDASAMASFDYATAIYNYFGVVGSTKGTSTYYGGTYQNPYGYYNGSEVGFRYTGVSNDAQVIMNGENIAYDGLISQTSHGISGDVDGFQLGYYDSNTTYTDDGTNRSELQGVIQGLVVSGLDYSAAVGTGTGSDNLVNTLYYALQKANTIVDLDGDGTSGYEYIDLIYSLLGAKAQHFIGSDGADNYTGTIYGDLIDGGLGADTLAGGAGDDIYVVDDAGDVVVENADEGTDTVQASINYTLGANVENLTLTGSALTGTGNSLDNILTGNSLNNTLDGGDGNDTLDGGAGDDTLDGGAGDDIYIIDSRNDVIVEDEDGGTDTIKTAISHYQIRDNVENIIQIGDAGQFSYGNSLNNTMTAVNTGGYLYGMEGTDTLIGGDGNDVLDGGTDADVMTGGLGNDTYYVDDASDVINELDGQGTDTVYASLDYVLGDFLENLTLLGSEEDGVADSDLGATGNAVANKMVGNDGKNHILGLAGNDTLYGGAGADTLEGGAGADKLYGGTGKDVLYGGAGKDTFVFVAGDTVKNAKNADFIMDFDSKDLIDLSGWDANEKKKGDQDFDFIGKHKFTGDAGEVRYEIKSGDTYIYGDTDGDKKIDFAIHLDGKHAINAGDFLF